MPAGQTPLEIGWGETSFLYCTVLHWHGVPSANCVPCSLLILPYRGFMKVEYNVSIMLMLTKLLKRVCPSMNFSPCVIVYHQSTHRSIFFNDADVFCGAHSFPYRDSFHRELHSHPSCDHLHQPRLENFQSCPGF